MSNRLRRVPPPTNHYNAVPQQPPPPPPKPLHQRQYSYNNTGTLPHVPARGPSTRSQRRPEVEDVATGAIGAGYGPYSYNPQEELGYGQSRQPNTRYQVPPSQTSVASTSDEKSRATSPGQPALAANTATVPTMLWDNKDPDLDDALHNPDPRRDRDNDFTIFSWRGWVNAIALALIGSGILFLFAGYPIMAHFRQHKLASTGFNLGGINASGQIPDMRGLIDPDTPSSAQTYSGTDGNTYNLVFSDEFSTDGRTFWPGDDPYFTGVDLNYWPTGDLEWYNPQAITTKDGKLVITMTEQDTHNLNFQSGMLTSWNQLCFTTGYIEMSVSMPGTPQAPGLWPAGWIMGNLGRAGYGATTEGMWPYTYDTCDLGTFPNQTNKDGTPTTNANGGANGDGALSFLPGQRLSACTCPNSDHPGPSTSDGRGVPEIDIFETQIDTALFQGQASQSLQVAPFNFEYIFDNSSTTIYDDTLTEWNTYTGGTLQQAVSALSYIEDQFYNGNGYAKYGIEWWSNPSNRDEGYVTWFSNGQKTWTAEAGAIGADSTAEISNRLISEEPMYIILNLGMAPGFQKQDFEHLTFPVSMNIDYIRIYQRDDVKEGITCNPSHHPTADYINNHINAYSNPNLTTWAQANYTFPRNSLYDGC